jgi:hypothetical protein
LVSADVSQPIQKIIGISWIMSADTNNVSGIRGVLRRRETLIVKKFGFVASGYPIFPALYAAASLDAASLGASVASLDARSSLSPSSTPPSASKLRRRQPHPQPHLRSQHRWRCPCHRPRPHRRSRPRRTITSKVSAIVTNHFRHGFHALA